MQFNQDFEKIFFKLSLKKPKYLQSIKAGFYTSEEIDILSRLAAKFHDKYQETPSKEQTKLLAQRTKSASKIDPNIIDMIFDVNLNEYDEEWLTSTAESWIKWRNFDISLIDTVEFIKTTEVTPENTESIISKVKSLINDRNNLTFNSDLGLDFFDPMSHDQKETEKVSSGYNFIDYALGGGYDKGGNLVVYAGEQNIGKSIFLANDAATSVKMGHNTAVITAEMAAHKFVKRLGANLLTIPVNEYQEKAKNKDFIKRKLESVGNGLTVPGQLFVKQFPTSQATVPDIEAYLQQIEEEKKIKMDVVVIDYINILANHRNQNTENTYMKIKQIAEDLRALAVKRDMLVISATQINRGAWDSTEIKMENIAESAGLAHTADVMYAIIQDAMMHANREYWLKILKIRDGQGKGSRCRFEIDYDHMRITETDDITH